LRNKLTVAALAAALSLIATGALAHTSIAESNPADNSTVEALPEEVSIRFGNATIPAPQPAQLSDATLLVLDPCGARVDNEDAAWDQTTSTITATTTTREKAGRYEMHWGGTSTDGDAQAGIVDFVATGGSECASVVRPDAADDVDLGFNPVKIVSRPAGTGAAVTVTLKDKLTCKSFATAGGRLLTVAMDTNWDEEVDYTGTFTCRTKKVRRNGQIRRVPVYGLSVAQDGDEDPSSKLKVKASSAYALTASIPASILEDPANGSLDLYVSSTTDSDECDEDTRCADRAPDLGWVRSL
jgi:methionine-rich copper-binding protein CopC